MVLGPAPGRMERNGTSWTAAQMKAALTCGRPNGSGSSPELITPSGPEAGHNGVVSQPSRARPPAGPRHLRHQRHQRRPRWPLAAGLAAGVALDALLGDPQRGHPVAAFGRAATALESRDYADTRLRGALHATACVLAAAAPAVLMHRRTPGRLLLEAAVAAITVWAVMGGRSLSFYAERASVSLSRHDLDAARQILPSLCGRDPAGLGATEIARAVIESVAENASDAVVAPLLWGAVAGPPGLAAYRAVNTLDAMVGHHTPRYLRFGWASARLDDVANYIPARLTAVLAAF